MCKQCREDLKNVAASVKEHAPEQAKALYELAKKANEKIGVPDTPANAYLTAFYLAGFLLENSNMDDAQRNAIRQNSEFSQAMGHMQGHIMRCAKNSLN